MLLPLGLALFAVGMLIKAVYSTFTYAAWTEFYRRMPDRAGPAVGGRAVPETPTPPRTTDVA